ncbi:unnamed protein product [Arctia plantaginis]|uniref:unspecific monooxygenase n=1 Tax=Arctia plantaginis TaxID=874455 RepID=A0A8S1B115_ARCPL|nr:unnamed protein product [Arctia plantaginis]
MIILLASILAVIVVGMIYLRQIRSSFTKHGVKHVTPLPLVGNMANLYLGFEHFADHITKLYNKFPKERFIGRFEFINEYVVIRDLDLVEQIAFKDHDCFDHRSILSESKSFFARNLLALNGQEWKAMRAILSPAFTNSKIRKMVPLITEVGENTIEWLQRKMKESQKTVVLKYSISYGEISVNCEDLTACYANDVIASCIFGLKINSYTDPENPFYARGRESITLGLGKMVVYFLMTNVPALAKIFEWDILSKRCREFFRKVVLDVIKDRKMNQIMRHDIIHFLMEAQGVLTDDDIVAQVLLFFIEGFGTVSSLMNFLLYELAVNIDVQDRLVKEIREHDAKHNGELSYESLKEMEYLHMVMLEVLRLWHPSMILDRKCNRNYNLGKPNKDAKKDFVVKKGTMITIPIHAIHRDPQYFPDPEKFDPERFSAENKQKIHPFAFIPFGVGHRNCIGNKLGLCEIKGLIYQILLRIEILPTEATCIPAKLCPSSFSLKLQGGHTLSNYELVKMLILFIIIALVVVFGIVYLRQIFSTFSKYGVKFVTPMPVVGNMARLYLRREHFADHITRLYNEFPEERFFGKFEFVNELVVIRDLDLIKRIALQDFECFDHRSVFSESNSFFAKNLFGLNGQEWKEMRATLSPAFTSSKIRKMVPLIVDVGDQMIAMFKRKIKESKTDYIDIDCEDLTACYANDVIASCQFGLKIDSYSNPENPFFTGGKEFTHFGFQEMVIYLIMSNIPILAKMLEWDIVSKKCKDFFRKVVLDMMRDREEKQTVRPDMIYLLMEAKKGKLVDDTPKCDEVLNGTTAEESAANTNVAKKVLTDDDIISQIVLFFVEAFGTVSTLMTFLLYELAINPDVQDRLAKEVKEYNVKNGGKLDYDSLKDMKYLDMVTSEVIRLWHPSIILDRTLNRDYNLGKPNKYAEKDFKVRKGTLLTIPIYAIHRDPQYFPNPEKFDPERFSPENKQKIPSFAYNPFGLGPRNCIGLRLGLSEMKAITYQILLHTEILPTKSTCIPAKLCPNSFTLKLQGGHTLRFKLRS